MTASATCPVCSEQFDSPVTFALHVAACTMPPADVSTTTNTPTPTATALATAALATPTASCPTCHLVYTSALAPHEILFHEEECDRVNEYNGPVLPMRLDANGGLSGGDSNSGGSGGRPMSGGKRSRENVGTTTTTATASAASAAPGPKVTLFPANCAVCDAGGRTLLHCAGKCARSFHPMCIEEINVARDFAANGTTAIVGASALSSASGTSAGGGSSAAAGGSVSFASAITRDKKAQKAWVCGECTRGLHTCQLCGFLGHEGHEIVRCSVPDCGFFFHSACLREQNHRAQSPLVCPRHTCSACHAIETDMTRSSSCTKCCNSIHIHCREATATSTTTQSRGRGDVLDLNFHVCEAHKSDEQTGGTNAAVKPERKAAQYVGLKMQTRPGDLVLILEYGNLLLPSTAKDIAPDAYNQWGVVQRVENLGDGISSAWWTQLLTVSLFSDNSSISVPNRYVLPVGSMRQYSSPTLMIRDAIKWHAMSEIHVRHLEKQRAGTPVVASTVSPSAALANIVLAFKERANTLDISSTDRLASAGDGFASWQRFSSSASQTYLTSSAPAYIALDTRGRNKPNIEEGAALEGTSRVTRRPHEAEGGDDDVDMEDTSSSSDQGRDTATSAPASGSGKSRSAATEEGHDHVTAVVMEVLAQLLEGVQALHSRGGLLGGSSDTGTYGAKESLEDIVANLADDDDDDEDMADSLELPPLRDDEGSDDEQSNENRLSMDDLLKPLSQESIMCQESVPRSSPQQDTSLTPSSSTPMSPSKKEGSGKLVESSVEVNVWIKKRPLDPTEDENMDVSDIIKMSEVVRHHSEHVSKKMKINDDMKPAVVVNFSHLPLNLKKSCGSVFGRAPLPGRPALMNKDKLATEYPSVVLRDLQQKVDKFFETEDQLDQRHLKGFPSFRPAFYRPTPFLYRSVRVGRRVDSISRVLLCQDKRNLKCFVRVSTSSKPKPSKGMRSCAYDPNHNVHLSYVLIDLLGISDFPTLEKQVRTLVACAVATKGRSSGARGSSTGWHWQSSSGTSVTMEEEAREPEIRLSYCAYDGSEHALHAQKLLRQQQPEWLCFCANVVHLTATIVQH